MPRNQERTITCPDCGIKLVVTAPNARRCKECAVIHNRKMELIKKQNQYEKEKLRKRLASHPKVSSNHAELVRIARESRKIGVSYGYGVAAGVR